MIYLDYQASTPVDARVLSEMLPYFSELYGNPHSVDHYSGWQSAKAVDEAANSVARLIGADSNEIIFTSGATEANNLALFGLARHEQDGSGQRVLVSAIEHKSVLATVDAIERQLGYEVVLIPVDSEGLVILPELEKALASERTLIVSIMLVNNEIGTIQPYKEISRLCRNYGVLYHSDATQAPVSLCLGELANYSDLISLSAHKMYGPKGVGALYLSHNLNGRIEPIFYGGGQQYGVRSGTVPTALCVGMGVAARLCMESFENQDHKQISKMRDNFVKGVRSLRKLIHLNGPKYSNRLAGNANIRFDGFCAQDILGALQPNLAASTGSACTSGIPESSYVLQAIGLSESQAGSSIRFSIGRQTTDAEIKKAINFVSDVLDRLENLNV